MSSEMQAHNLLRGTADLSGCHYTTDISVAEDPGLGFAVARLTPTTTLGGLIFDSQDVPESERVSEAAFCLSFLARADVAGDRIHSEVWGSRYKLDTTLGTGWRLVTMPYGFVDSMNAKVYFNGITGNSGAVYLALPMANRGTTPAAWAPAEGETLSGGGAQMSANIWSDSTASMQIRADGTYLAGKVSGDLYSAVTGLASLTENQNIHIGASLKNAGAGVLKPFVEYKDAAGNLNWVGFQSWQPTDSWQRFEDTCVVPSGMTVCGVGFDASGATGDIEVSNPVFNYGSTGIVMAAGSVTVASINDVASTTRYYLLQSSTLTAPAAPTANPPGGSWATTEPTYTEGSTNSLYTCDQTIFSDGTWAYSSVSLSTSYEAAKAAYNKAAAASAAAAVTDQHFWADTDGAHVSSTGDHDTSGFHQLMTSVKNAFMHGSTELMTISESLIELGKNSTSAVIKFCNDMLRMQYWSDKNLFELAANYGEADTHQNLALSFFNKTTGDFDERGAGLEFIPVGVNNHTAAEMCFWILCDTLQINVSNIRIGSEEYPISRLATAIQPVVSRDSGVITRYGSAVAHYTKIGTLSATVSVSTLRLRVMTGNGHDGHATQNSWIDIIVKDAWQSSNSTTKAFGVSYELHNVSSAELAPYVVATAYNSCDIWVKNSWEDESGWYIAEYGGPFGAGTWSDGGSVHQTSVPSGTLQSASCLGSAVYTGSKILTTTATIFQLLSSDEYSAITGHNPKGSYDSIAVCSGDDSSYRGIMSASIQSDTNVIVTCNPAPNGLIRVNYTITTG